MIGADFLPKLKRLSPNALLIGISGVHDPVADAANKDRVHKFLSKNWDSELLCSEVRKAYRQYCSAARMNVAQIFPDHAGAGVPGVAVPDDPGPLAGTRR